MIAGKGRPFALLLQRERVGLIDAEHGLVIEAAPLAAPKGHGKGWIFDAPAAQLPHCQQMFTHASFPLAVYFDWFLTRVYPVRKLSLTLVSNVQQPLSLSLWQHLFAGLGLREPLRVRSPLQCLGAQLKNGLLIHCEDGLAQLGAFRNRSAEESSQVGYGFYLSRAIRQYVQTRHGLRIDAATAEQAWLRLGSERQLTIQGQDSEGKARRQLLIAEELAAVFAAAVVPLLDEIGQLQQHFPQLPIQLLGPQSALPWLAELLTAKLKLPLQAPADSDSLLLRSIQQDLAAWG